MSSEPYRLADGILLAACREDRLRARGPGGQHANRTETGVRLVHLATGLSVVADHERSQERNRAQALADLRLRLACHDPGQPDVAWLAPHRAAPGRLRLSAQARDLAAVAAVLLHALAIHQGRLAEAAANLELSSSQFSAALMLRAELLAAANAIRSAHGHGPLHGR